MGGVGKTQTAIEYVYRFKDFYKAIFWIGATTEATLFSGCQDIATRVKCIPENSTFSSSEIVKHVLSWLNEQERYKHTLITTRNQHVESIPAEGLEVQVYHVNEAVELLLLRSQVRPVDETPDTRTEAVAIVEELGRLPLAIEQAAAYIREACKSLFKFLPEYRKNRRRQHSRVSISNRVYYKESIVTTWHLAFQKIEEHNTDAFKLLRLLAFLNPDGILIDFLEAGQFGLKNDLQAIFTDSYRLYEALGELERFSLITCQNNGVQGQKIIIHRLVQSIIKDEMSVELFSDMEIELIELCYAAFPEMATSRAEHGFLDASTSRAMGLPARLVCS
jgi:hypothetical protein